MTEELKPSATPIQATLVPVKVWIEKDMMGTVHIKRQHEGGPAFDFIQIQYSHMHTCNAHQHALAEQIVALLNGAALTQRPAAQADCVGCEGKPSATNSPCAVCMGAQHAGEPTHPADCQCEWCKGKPAAQATPERHLTVTTNQQGEAVMVSWQDDEHRILDVVWERKPATPEPVGEVVAWRYKIPTHGGGTAWTHTRPQPECLIEAQPLYTRPAPGVPEGLPAVLTDWGFDVHDDEEGRTWLTIRNPDDDVARMSVPTVWPLNGNQTIGAVVLHQFSAALTSALAAAQANGVDLEDLATAGAMLMGKGAEHA